MLFPLSLIIGYTFERKTNETKLELQNAHFVCHVFVTPRQHMCE